MRTLTPKLLVIAIASWLVPAFGLEEMVKVKGKGEVVYKGTQTPADERAAIEAAKTNAIIKYANTLPKRRFELYKKVEPEVLSKINEFVPDFTKLESAPDKDSERLVVTIEASINELLFEYVVQNASHTEPNKEKIAFVFVAREEATRTEFPTARNNGSVGTATNGMTTYKPKVATIDDVDKAVMRVLTEANYEPSDARAAELDEEAFQKDFLQAAKYSQKTFNSAVKVCKKKGIRYLSVGRMDVGVPTTDDATGNRRASVTVTLDITDLAPSVPRTVSSIAGAPIAALGANDREAIGKALLAAANDSASKIVDQLRVSGHVK